MLIRNIFITLSIFCPILLSAQPSGAQPGKCYANCYLPDQYYTETEQLMLQAPMNREMPSTAVFTKGKTPIEITPTTKSYLVIPAEYDTIVEKIEIRPKTVKYRIIPAEYEKTSTPSDQPVERKRLIAVPAVYETVTEQMQTAPAVTQYVITPPEYEYTSVDYAAEPAYLKVEMKEPRYENVAERVEIKPSTMKWIKKKGDPNCLQTDPEDCFVWCLVEEPAEYQTINKRVNRGCDGSGVPDAGCINIIPVPAKMATMKVKRLKTPASYREETSAAQFQTITRQVIRDTAYVREESIPEGVSAPTNKVVKTPARAIAEEIPAEYLTVVRLELRKPAEIREITLPAETKEVDIKVLAEPQTTLKTTVPGEFITVAKRVLARPGGFTEWREVLCDEKITGYTIKQIQTALKARGYDPGPINNQMGAKTKTALRQFQQENSLPVGNLDFETLNALGIKY